MTQRKVLILGSDVNSFLATVRSLGRYGLEVHVGWCPKDSPASHSRYIKKFHVLPDYDADSTEWLDAFKRLLTEEHFDLVVPTNDPTLLPLQLHRETFESLSPIYLLGQEIFKVTFDKQQCLQMAKQLGISVTSGEGVYSEKEAKDLTSRMQYPLVIRPARSYSYTDTENRLNAKKIYKPEELDVILPYYLEKGACVIQENFAGIGVGVEILAKNGKVLFAFQHERLHEYIYGGPSSYRKSCKLNPELLEATKKMVEALGYTGVAMFEYKLNKETGCWIFIEINARFWGSLPLTIAAGADMPVYLFQMLVEGKSEFSQSYNTEVYCRYLTKDFDWFRHNLFADKNDPSLQTVPLRKLIGEVLNILKLREHNDTFVIDDLLPGFVELWQWACSKFKVTWNILRQWNSNFSFMRKQRQKKLKSVILNAKSILFICYGNICRSSFAEACARKILPDILFQSAGFYRKKGRLVPQAGQEAAQGLGFDLGDYRSKVVTQGMIDSADLIFVFDVKNHDLVIKNFPKAKDKTYFLGDLTTDDNFIIDDPYGKDIYVFKTTYQRIKKAIERISDIKKLIKDPRPVIGQFIDTPGVGGAETMVVEIAANLRNYNVDPVVLCFEKGITFERATSLGLKVLMLPGQRWYRSKLTLPLFLLQFRRFLKTHNISLLHSHLVGPIVASSTVCASLGIPHVGTLHDTFIVNQSKRNWFLLRLATYLGTRLITVSESMQNYYQRRMVFKTGSIHLIKNGINVDVVDKKQPKDLRQSLNVSADAFVCIFVGRIVHLKRVDMILKAFAKLKDQKNLVLLLVGDGDYANEAENLAGFLGVKDRVRFLGLRNDVEHLLQISDLFIIASETEGLSRSILEAMASGLPVIATDVGGNRELIEEGRNGFLIPVGDELALTERISTLVSDRALCSQMGKNSLTIAGEKFSINVMVEKYCRLYGELLGTRLV